MLPTGQHADLAEDGRHAIATIGDQHHRRRGARPEDQPVAKPARRRLPADRLAHDIDPRVQPDGHQHAGRVGLHNADAHRLRHVAGKIDFQDVRLVRVRNRQRVGLPTHVGRFPARTEPNQLAQRMTPGRHGAVAQRTVEPPRGGGKLRQLGQPFPPAGIRRIDLDHRAEVGRIRPLAGQLRIRLPLGAEHQQLDLALGQGLALPLLRSQRHADRFLPAAALRGRHDQLVHALDLRQRNVQRDRRRLACAGLMVRDPGFLLAARGDQPGLDLHLAAGSCRQQVRFQRELELLARGEDQGVASLDADPQTVARRAAYQQSIALLVERLVVESGRKIGQGNLELDRPARRTGGGRARRTGRIVRRRQLDQQLGLLRGSDQEVDSVVGPGAALADGQLRGIEPHRSRLVGLDAQRPRFGQRAFLAQRDGAFPPPFRPATPGDPHPHRLVGSSSRRGNQGRRQQRKPRTPPDDRGPGTARIRRARCLRTSLPDHRRSIGR